MSLQEGQELREYRVTGLLGQGAMGTVYRAHDRKLGRDVALKVLSPELSRGEEQLARFEREARVLASLNHPGIAMIHGVGHVEDVHFIVLELVEGVDLTSVVTSPRYSLREKLELALQLATALEDAHARGIVHRDLKPGNVKVTADGKLKVLDFGIAKCFSEAERKPTGDGATLTELSTHTGVVLGTVGYMSPEQVRALEVDGRSDIWAFGCVLFELLTGRRAFRGKSPTETLMLVLDVDPPWQAIPADVPVPIQRLVERCLRKDRNKRLQSIGDARVEIEDVLDGDLHDRPSRSRSGTARFLLGSGVVSAIVASLAAGFWAGRTGLGLSGGETPASPSVSPVRVTRSSFTLPEAAFLPIEGQRSIAISSDGSRLAYVVEEGSEPSRILERRLDRLESSLVLETSGARDPFFSPAGQWLGFVTTDGDSHRLLRVSAEGGAPVVFHEEPGAPPAGVSWTRTDEVLFAGEKGIRVISPNGGVPTRLACRTTAKNETRCLWPQMLPGGASVLYTRISSGEAAVVAEVLGTGQTKTIVEDAGSARYSETGHVVYEQAGALFAAGFDPDLLELTTPPVRLAADVLVDPETRAAQFDVSKEGTLTLVSGMKAEPPAYRLLLLDDSGQPSPASEILSDLMLRGVFRLSPDGRTIALTLEERGSLDVWLHDLQERTLSRFTDGGSDDRPVWSPDGTRLVFRSMTHGRPGFYVKSLEGDAAAVPLLNAEGLDAPSSWEASRVAFTTMTETTGSDVWILDPGSGDSVPVLASSGNETEPALSPDATRLAFVSDTTGVREVYVTDVEAPERVLRVSEAGGRAPRWSRDGTTIYYRSRTSLVSVSLESDDSEGGSSEREWRLDAGMESFFETTPGGGFLVAQERTGPRRVIVVTQFPAEVAP